MIKKKIMFVFGTRPEAIKMAPLIHSLKAQSDFFDVTVCVTAQHRQMLDQTLKVFDILPDFDLNIMRPQQDLYDVTTSVLLGLRDLFAKNKPDFVLVHGDTTTTFATAIACFYSRIKICHVEAGLRTHNIFAPYPEEFNRQVAAKVMNWHFAPTKLSRANLLAEGVSDQLITVTGNTVIDAIKWILNRFEDQPARLIKVEAKIDELLSFDWRNERFILITGHRRENFGSGFIEICEALRELALSFKEVHFVYPVHMNPNVQRPVYSILAGSPNIHLISSLDYEPFVYLLKHSYFVLTDSGGIQEEAPSLGKPVLVLRELTERPEAVDAGTVKLVGSKKQSIVSGVAKLLSSGDEYIMMARALNPYGDGHACERIIKILKDLE